LGTGGRDALVLLEWDDLKRHAEDLGDLFAQPARLADLVARAPEPSAHHLLAQ
jgi:hypothetical protein